MDCQHVRLVADRVQQAVALGLDQPIMVLETGYPTQPDWKGFSEAGQVAYIEDATIMSYEAGAAGFFYFTLVSAEIGGEGPEVVEPYWGLIRRDDTRKPAWYTYRDIASRYR